MKKIKSLFIVALSLLLCVCVFSGCGVSKEEAKYTTLHNRNLELTDSEETFVEADNLVVKQSGGIVSLYEPKDISFKLAGIEYNTVNYLFENGRLYSMYYTMNLEQELNEEAAYDKLKKQLSFIYGEPINSEGNTWEVEFSNGSMFEISTGSGLAIVINSTTDYQW